MDAISSKTAGLIIIGNEILTGKVHDINSFYLTSELRALGVEVRRISVIPDEIDMIGIEALEFSGLFDYVFTTGGVGPTHDDVTMAGIAKGFGVKLVSHPGIKKVLAERFKSSLNDPVMKMTEVPEGAEVIVNDKMRFPIILFKNIYIFPGIPEYLKNKFPFIRERLRSSSFYVKRLFLNAHESHIAGALNNIVKKYRDVIFGSYPVVGRDDYRVVITAESKSADSLKRAFDELTKILPKEIICGIE
jgi:FAD synthetase